MGAKFIFMKTQLYENLLNKLKNARPARKLTMAQENGFETVSEYKDYLEGQISALGSTQVEETPVVSAKIHYVDILDISASMLGAKILSANQGIHTLCEQVRKDVNAEFYSLYTFGARRQQSEASFQPASNAHHTPCTAYGSSTALYYTLNNVLRSLSKRCAADAKVLVNIYTDGGDNDSSLLERESAAALIDELQKKNFTITFIGTEQDVNNVIKSVGIDQSNTLVYDGTGAGLKQSIGVTMSARASYSHKVSQGMDVSRGFYKSFNK